MNLGQKTLLIVSLSVAGVMAVLYLVGRDLLLRSYLELEAEQTSSAVARAETSLNDQIANLAATTNDYGAWDRTYTFMQQRSPDYIRQEFENATLQGLHVNSVLLADTSQQISFFKAYNDVQNVAVPVPKALQASLAKDPWVRRALLTSSPAHGILLLAQNPVLIAVCPILTTDRQGPARGVLIMTRNLDGPLVDRLKERAMSSLAIYPATSATLSSDLQTARTALELRSEGAHVQPLDETTVAGYSFLRDIHGQGALLLRVEMPRPVFQRGLVSLRYLVAILCSASLMFGLTTLFLLRRIVLARLTQLSTEVGLIGSSGAKDFSRRILVPGRDEIGRLGRDINHMLESLQKNAGLERMNEVLRREVENRQLAEKALEEGILLTTLSAQIGAALAKATATRPGLQQCAEAFVRYLDLAFARVWTCNQATNTLELEASAGMYTHLDGPHARVPVGTLKIGRIAQSRLYHLTNDVLHDPQIGDPEWAQREGMVAFAGYPLIVESQVVGVIAAFARHPLTKAAVECFASVADQIAQFIQRISAQEALHASTKHFRQLFATIPIPVCLRDRSTGHFLEVNDAAIKLYGYPREQFLQMTIADIVVSDEIMSPSVSQTRDQSDQILKERHRTRDGVIDVEVKISPVAFTAVPALLAVAQDVTERNQMAIERLHGQKLQAVGALAAGVAHEINTPIQFVGDNVRFLRDAFTGMAKVLEQYEAFYQAIRGESLPQAALDELDAALRQADLEFLRKEVPLALDQTLDGVSRVATIVQALKMFSPADLGAQVAADLNSALESTLVVARNELKYLAEVETAFGNLPPVVCYPGDLNQVFLNLLLNAAHSIEDVVNGTGDKGKIRVETHVEGDWAVVAIGDTGAGIPENIRDRIFEPFFTTKPVGKGTGQGLALARTIVEKHGGCLSFESEMARGTTFFVRIPIYGLAAQVPQSATAAASE